MINRLLFLILILITGSANALVATTPEFSIYNPSGTNAGGFIKGTGAIWQPAANAYSIPAKINIAGQSVNLIAKAPLAATALNFVRTSILANPYLVVGSLLLAYYQSQQIAEFDAVSQQWSKPGTVYAPSGSQIISAYPVMNSSGINPIYGFWTSCQAACSQVGASCLPGQGAWGTDACGTTSYFTAYQGVLICPSGMAASIGVGGRLQCVSSPVSIPMTPADWTSIPTTLPDTVKQELPEADYMPQGVPVDTPVFEPQTVTIGEPYTKPDGSTAQPMAKISPQPDGKVGVDTYEQPLTDPQGNPIANPTPTDTPEPQPDPDICKANPNILACQKLDIGPDTEVIQTDTLNLSLTPESVGGAGSCPAPINFSVLGHQMAFKYDLVCQGAGYLRPLILAIAWLSAGIVFIGGVRGG